MSKLSKAVKKATGISLGDLVGTAGGLFGLPTGGLFGSSAPSGGVPGIVSATSVPPPSITVNVPPAAAQVATETKTNTNVYLIAGGVAAAALVLSAVVFTVTRRS